MPNLLNSDLAQNYRRTHVGTSRFGTRTLQLYEIWIYGLSDNVANTLFDGSRDTNLEDDSADQPSAVELAGGSIIEAILRGAQVMGEIYVVGQPDTFNNDPDDNDLVITIGVAADTLDSGWEQYVGTYFSNSQQNSNNNATDLYYSIGDNVDEWADRNGEYWNDLDVWPVFLVGESTSNAYGPFALPKDDPARVAYRAAKQAKRAEAKASLQNPKSFTPKMKRPD